ncbi:MAG: DUF3783 domain-containing protein [Romboutsia sp.]|uniref:DUF3783 domain-containing protein n=1 Tax=Romboutsia sp. TaxID=1965302 RepID=UPI003F2C31D4
MSFSKITDININEDDRSFVILYNFNNKEISMVKNILSMFGIKDIEILSRKNANTKISDVINKEIDNNCDDAINQKSMIFNNVAPMKVSAFIDSLKKFRINRPLIAFVTENNINWTLNTLVSHLLEERLALKSGKTIKH